MESCSDISVVEPSATYSLVLFHDIPHTYPPSTPVTCQYTLTAGFLPNTRDWVGVFKVGWSSTKDYHTFVWVEPFSDVEREEPVKKQVIFNEYYLPKDDAEFYQFCYVDSSGQVRGASTPFCFKLPEEPSVDCSLETDLLVITTQEQVEQSARERDELQKEVDQMRLQNESIKSALMEKQREVDHLKEQQDGSEQERKELGEELSQTKQQNESLRSNLREQQQELDRVKEDLIQKAHQLEQQNSREEEKLSQSLKSVDESQREQEVKQKYDRAVVKINQLKQEREELNAKLDIQSVEIAELKPKVREQERELLKLRDVIQLLQEDLIQKAHQLEQQNSREEEKLSQSLKSVDESQREQEVKQKYDRAVVKINQLKREREELNGKLDIQSVEIAELKPKVREQERELLKLRDVIQLLQADLQSSEKEKERLHVELRRLHELTHNVDELKRENAELRRSQQETLQNIPDEDMKVRYETLLNQLQEARAQLSDERQLFNSAQRQLEHLDRELLDTKEQLDGLALSSDQSKRCSSKLELRLTEAHSIIAEMNVNTTEMDNRITIEQQEKEELERQIRNLERDNDRLGRELAEQIASAADSLYMQPSSPHGFSPEAITTSSQGQQQDTLPESLQYDEALFETIGTIADTEEEESFVCRHCQETFPGFTREERVLHEQSHQVCPFCTLICDSMEQSVFEDHVYSHEL